MKKVPEMKSTLEKTVLKNVEAVKKELEKAEEKKRLAEAAHKAKLPATREEMARILYPSITDGGKWDYYHDGGQWRLRFFVGGHEFNIWNEYIPECRDVEYSHEAYWAPYLFAKNPSRHGFLTLGAIKEVPEHYVAGRNDKVLKRDDGSVYWDPKKILEKAVEEANHSIEKMIQHFMLNKDNYEYIQRLEGRYS